MWIAARFLIAREVIRIEDLRWIENLARLAVVLIINDHGSGIDVLNG
jgi:hypothetical protein